MKKTQLLTEFVRVATSGRTADGRTIEAEDLKTMAKRYNPELYTAQIWLEHDRYYPPLGQVVALQAIDNADGKTELFAQLSPTFEMIAMNKRGQGLFTSIEITPDFSDTGEAYLTGLAVTDSPASVGTTQLSFNTQKHPVIISDGLRFNFNLYQEGNNAMSKENARWSFFSRLFNTKDEPEVPEKPEAPEKQPHSEEESATEGETHFNEKEEMNEKQILAIATVIAKAFSDQKKGLKFSEEEKEEEKVTITKAEYDALVDTAKKAEEAEANAEKAQEELADLKERVSELEEQFSVVRKKPVTKMPNGAENKFSVNTAI